MVSMAGYMLAILNYEELQALLVAMCFLGPTILSDIAPMVSVEGL